MSNINKNQTIAKNTIFLYLRMSLVLLLSLVITRNLLKVLGVVDYGIYNIVAGFVSLFSFLSVSLTSSIQRFYNYEGGKYGAIGWSKVFITAIYIEIIFAFIIIALLETLGIWYINNKLVVPIDRIHEARCLFQFSCLQMVIIMIQAPFSALIMAKERMNYYAIIGIIEVVAKLMLILILPHIRYDRLVAFGCLSSILTISIFLMYYVYARLKFRECKFKWIWDYRLFKDIISFSGWSIFGSATIVARTQGVNILLNSFFGAVVNAARGIAFQIQSAVLGFTQNLTIAVRPQLTESYAKGDHVRAQSLMFTISKVSFVLLYIIALPIIFEIDVILKVWLGNSVPEYTNQFTQLILIAALIDVLNTPISILIMASGKVKVYSLITSLVGILILPISYLFLKMNWPPYIVFIVGIVISICVQAASILVMSRQTQISVQLYVSKVIIPLIGLVLLTFWIPFLVHLMPIGEYYVSLLNVIITSIAIFVSSFFLVFTKNERKYILKFVKK